MAFGQYSQGYVNEGTYKLTESQLRLYYYMTWTFGGKWLNWFRFLQGDGYGGQTAPTDWSLLLEQGMPGHPTKHMDWVNRCNREPAYWRLFGTFENNRCPLCAGYYQVYGRQTGDDLRS